MAIRDRLRRTMMFLPGNNPSMITDAHIYKPDSIMIDLEDAVSVNPVSYTHLILFICTLIWWVLPVSMATSTKE